MGQAVVAQIVHGSTDGIGYRMGGQSQQDIPSGQGRVRRPCDEIKC